ncbi:MAG: AEC family transporter [Clostridiales bacterium]|nr:AEC family transporter [Clostridiales bacterium]
MDTGVLIKVMVKLFSLMLLGFAVNKAGILDNHSNQKLSALIVNVTMPLLIISSVLKADSENRFSVLLLIAAGVGMYVLFIVFAKALVRILRLPKGDRRAYECMMVFANSALMGYPVVQSALGDEAVFYTSMIHFAYNIFIYTFGINSFRPKTSEKEKFSLRKIINPGFVLCILALVIYISGIRSDGIVYETIYMAGNVTSPLSMIVLGSILALYPIKQSLTDLRCYGFSLIRLIVIPVITFAICRILNISNYYTSIITITNAMPVGSMVLMLAAQYNSESKELISRNILVTTLLANITIPLLGMILF